MTNLVRDAFGDVIPKQSLVNGAYTVSANGDVSSVDFSKKKLLRDAYGDVVPNQYYDVQRGTFVEGALDSERTIKIENDVNMLKITKNNIKSSGFPFPQDLIAFWDFSEDAAPYYSKSGVDLFPLHVGGNTKPTKSVGEPFGGGIKFNGISDYLKIDSNNVGALNVAKSGDEVTVIAWIKRPSNSTNPNSFIAGMWQEDNNAPKRQYGLFNHLPLYGGWNRVCGHVSKTGGASPNLPYSRDYSTTGSMVGRNVPRCIGFTYDGNEIKSYIDGLTDIVPRYTEPNAPNGEGLTYAKNPYSFDLGLNRKQISDFTVGAVKLTNGFGNWFDGHLYGLAIFRRALTSDEMMKIHLDSVPKNEPIQYFDFFVYEDDVVKTLAQYGWRTVRGLNAFDHSKEDKATASWGVTRLGNGMNKPFMFISTVTGEEQASNAFTYNLLERTVFEKIKISQIDRIQFTTNNSSSENGIRICLKIDGVWYATSTSYSDKGVGTSGANWTTGFTQSAIIERKKENWLILDYRVGIRLELKSAPTNDLPNKEIEGFAILANPLKSGSVIRLTDIKIYS